MMALLGPSIHEEGSVRKQAQPSHPVQSSHLSDKCYTTFTSIFLDAYTF